MKRLAFKCTFVTDVVLNQNSATEGNTTTLDYIPGSNFLGLAAARLGYDNLDPEVAYDLFHSSKVRFVDGHLAHEGQRSLKVPLDWYFPKGKKLTDACYLMHKARPEVLAKFQPKQARSGFFTADGALLKPEKSMSLKSAYNRTERRSDDGKMFGYEALNAGQQWIFYVDLDSDAEQHQQLLMEALCGYRSLGRSRSAQYGRVLIEELDEQNQPCVEFEGTSGQDVLIYAETPIALFNEYGFARTTVNAEDFGLEGQVCYEKCQIRTRQYSPWNAKRGSRDADRLVIDKGSVFVLKLTADCKSQVMGVGVGAYRNEGLGQVLVNPDFLTQSDEQARAALKLKIAEVQLHQPTQEGPADLSPTEEILLEVLGQRVEKSDTSAGNYELVADFIQVYGDIYSGIKNSQWGEIRKLAAQCKGDKKHLCDLLFEEDRGYLVHGILSDEWEMKGRLDALRFFIEHKKANTTTVELLASEMTKLNR